MQQRKTGTASRRPASKGPHYEERQGRPKRNIWKWLFLALVALIAAAGFVSVSRMLTPREDVQQLHTTDTSKDALIGTFTTNREQLNDTVATYLKAYKLDDYKLYADKQQILLEGQVNFLEKKLPFYAYFQPSKLEDGSILLSLMDLSVGTFSVPRSFVLSSIAKSGNLPDFVEINTEKATITVRLPEIENQMDIYAKANTIDLYNDQIIFDIYRKST